jgi:hypothetical protein
MKKQKSNGIKQYSMTLLMFVLMFGVLIVGVIMILSFYVGQIQ